MSKEDMMRVLGGFIAAVMLVLMVICLMASWQFVHNHSTLSNTHSVFVALAFWVVGIGIVGMCWPSSKESEQPDMFYESIASIEKEREKTKQIKLVQQGLVRKPSYFEMVKQFHSTFEQPIQTLPRFPSQDRRMLRMALVREEMKELENAEATNDLVEVADALGDIIYVIIGMAIEYGIDMDEIFGEIHRSNLSKLNKDGSIKKSENGKVLKGDQYKPPQIEKVLYADSRKEEGNASSTT